MGLKGGVLVTPEAVERIKVAVHDHTLRLEKSEDARKAP